MIIRRPIGEKGQVVIPKDIREMLGLRAGGEVVFEITRDEIRIKKEQEPEEFLKDFLNVHRPKKPLTTKDIKRELEERHEIR